ncbi:uncharacterized protein LOC110974035 [Acanthaster planci]|uniref:Uncharacterized protein LOC110974035 n=1 Tax=Acanthaster planci TaxID=133434 RepID=A0A8B7XLP6_ACAPL|nr:uncharacterized protein LOC110974035 [Acanthaster planci]
MTNFLGLLILFAVVMSANGRQLQEVFSTPQNGPFLCMWCDMVVTFVRNVSTDRDFLDLLVKNRKEACHFWSPAGFEKYCEDYVNEIPHSIALFADEYLDPAKDCATVCRGQEPDQQHPTALNNFVQKMKSDYEKFWK